MIVDGEIEGIRGLGKGKVARGDCVGERIFLGDGGWGMDHEWARIFTNGEGRGNGRDEGKVARGGLCAEGDFWEIVD